MRGGGSNGKRPNRWATGVQSRGMKTASLSGNTPQVMQDGTNETRSYNICTEQRFVCRREELSQGKGDLDGRSHFLRYRSSIPLPSPLSFREKRTSLTSKHEQSQDVARWLFVKSIISLRKILSEFSHWSYLVKENRIFFSLNFISLILIYFLRLTSILFTITVETYGDICKCASIIVRFLRLNQSLKLCHVSL